MIKSKEKLGKSVLLASGFVAVVTIYALFLALYPSWFQNLEGDFWRNESENLMDHAEYLTTGSTLRLPELQQALSFRSLEEDRYHFARSGEAMWIRIPASVLKEDYVIFSEDAYIRNYDIYFPIKEGSRTVYQNTELLSSGKVRGRSIHAFAHMPGSVDKTLPVYIRVEGPVMNPEFRTMVYEDFSIFENRFGVFLTSHFTVFLLIFLVNIVLFYIFKERSYLFHGLFQLFTTLSLYYYTSFGNRMYDMGKSYYYVEFQLLALTFMYFFLYDYLEVKTRGFLFNGLYQIALSVTLFSTLLTFLFQNDFEMMFGSLIASVSYIYIFLATFYVYQRKSKLLVWIPVSTYVLMVASVLHSLSLFAVVERDISMDLMIFTAVLVESVIFTYSIFYYIREQSQENAYLKNQVTLDHLTGLKNRYYLDKYAKDKMMTLEKHGKPTSMVILDIDFFKSVNDDFGHDRGDAVLQELAKKLESTFRKEDSVTRLGGEEFIILLYDSSLKTALDLAERARSVIEHTDFQLNRPLTISLGVAEKLPGESFNDLYKRADEALYTAKSMGRNQVRHSKETRNPGPLESSTEN